MLLFNAIGLLFLLMGPGPLFAQSLTDVYRWNPEVDTDELIDNWGLDPEELEVPRGGSRSGVFQENFNSGKAATTFGSVDGAARAGAIQTDGRVVLVGRRANAPFNDFAVVRFFPDGSIDTGFGTDGRVFVTYGADTGSDEVAHATVLQTDGKILVAGKAASGANYGFAVFRLNANGTLDTTFNSTGKVSTAIFGTADIARAIAVDTQQRIILGGYGYNSTKFDAAVARYTSNGLLDTAFDLDGKKAISITANDNGILAIELDTLNRILSASNAYNGSNWDFVVARLMTEGQLDTTFKSNGSLTISFGTSDDLPYGLATHTDSTIAVAGSSIDNAGLIQFALARILSSGTLDTTFNSSGKATLDIGGTGVNIPYGVKTQTDGKLLLGGKAKTAAQFRFALARYNINGTLDTTYNSSGKFTDSIGSGENSAQALLMWGDDLVYLAGRANDGTVLNAAMMRFATDGTLALAGSLDAGFGTRGRTSSDISGIDMAYALMAQSDAKLVLAGTAGNLNSIAIVRYEWDGRLDTTFSSDGIVHDRTLSGFQNIAGATLATDGKVLVGMRLATGSTALKIARYTTSGLLDTSFYSTGYRADASGTSVGDIVLQSDGKIVVGIGKEEGVGVPFLKAMRYLTDGNLDTTFNSSGFAAGTNAHAPLDVALLTNGAIQVYGQISFNYAFEKYTSDGLFDTSFDRDGYLTQSFPDADVNGSDMELESTEKAVTIGRRATAADQFVLARYTTSGLLDTTFNSRGEILGVSGIGWAITIQPNDKIVALGMTIINSYNRFKFVRYLTNGNLDTTFATVGFESNTYNGNLSEALEGGGALVVTPKGKICGAGREGTSTWDFLAKCYWP